MGKKKGKQSAGFQSKSLRAAFLRERHAISEDRSYSQFSARSANDSKITSHNGRKISSNVVAACLDESNSYPYEEVRKRNTDFPSIANAPGWIHTYLEPEEIARHRFLLRKRRFSPEKKIRAGKNQNQACRHCPTLQVLCIHALAPVFSQYLKQLGTQEMNSILSTCSPQILTLLSTLVNCENDEIIFALANHTHIDKLSLCFRGQKFQNTQYSHRGSIRAKKQLLTEGALLDLVPKLKSSKSFEQTKLGSDITEDTNNQNLPSWEEIVDLNCYDEDCRSPEFILKWEGCVNLKRLEIKDSSDFSLNVLFKFLRNCPKITHLSFNNSFQKCVGAEVLLNPRNGVLGLNNSFHRNGKVLDLSYCTWLTDKILFDFMRLLYIRSYEIDHEEYEDEDEKNGFCKWNGRSTLRHLEVREHLKASESNEPTSEMLILSPCMKVIRVYQCSNLDVPKCVSYSLKLFGKSLFSIDEYCSIKNDTMVDHALFKKEILFHEIN